MSLECPCCGDDGALADAAGFFFDGQPLACGCKGWVSLDAETDPEITIDDCDCYEPQRGGGR